MLLYCLLDEINGPTASSENAWDFLFLEEPTKELHDLPWVWCSDVPGSLLVLQISLSCTLGCAKGCISAWPYRIVAKNTKEMDELTVFIHVIVIWSHCINPFHWTMPRVCSHNPLQRGLLLNHSPVSGHVISLLQPLCPDFRPKL